MGRYRQYPNGAERQRAYRQRRAAELARLRATVGDLQRELARAKRPADVAGGRAGDTARSNFPAGKV